MQKIVLTTESGKHFGLESSEAEIGRYPSGEISLNLKDDVTGADVFVVGSTGSPAENLVQMVLLIDKIRSGGAGKITAVIPYLGYSRADKEKFKGDAVSIQTAARVLESVGGKNFSVMSVDMHSPEGVKFFKVPFLNILAWHAMSQKITDNNDFSVLAPDAGAVIRASEFGKLIGVENISEIKKERLKNGEVVIKGISGNVERDVILVDDIVDTGGTLLKVINFLGTLGVKATTVCVTHTIWGSYGWKKLAESPLVKKVITTNSVKPPVRLPIKFELVDLSPILRGVIYG